MKRVSGTSFRANSINEFVAYACVCVINNKHGRELARVENELFQLRRKLTNVNQDNQVPRK